MRTLAWAFLRQFAEKGHADAIAPLKVWFRLAESADWASFADVKRDFPSADAVGNKLIFNIGGNKYRLIVLVSYRYRRLSLKWIGTHAEYDRLTRQDIEEL